ATYNRAGPIPLEGSPMSDANAFEGFLRRVRGGDAEAAAELVRRYEPAIRLEARYRLRDARLRRVFDTLDVCQLVLASFFTRAALGQYDLKEPQDLVKLLVVMAHNKAVALARGQRRQRRDARRVEAATREEM